MSISADLLRGYTDSIILSQLSRQDSYGYRIARTVSQQTGGALELKEATLYTAFKRLENSGCIRSYWGDEQSGARRRYYTITPEGRTKLKKDIEAWRETRAVLDGLIAENGEEPGQAQG